MIKLPENDKQGHDTKISSLANASGSNIILNLATIPRYGAMAAAINTIISYLVYLGALAWKARAVTRNVDGLSTQEG